MYRLNIRIIDFPRRLLHHVTTVQVQPRKLDQYHQVISVPNVENGYFFLIYLNIVLVACLLYYACRL